MKRYLLPTLAGIATYLLIYTINLHFVKPVTLPSNLVKTVAHVTPNSDIFELYATDVNNDVSWYLVKDTANIVAEGEEVFLRDGTSTFVYEADVLGFVINLPENTTASGLSGTHILNSEGTPVGIVSKLLGKDKLFCMWYNM